MSECKLTVKSKLTVNYYGDDYGDDYGDEIPICLNFEMPGSNIFYELN